ncbi:hypothetical protein FO519_003517 [Halicephalobus sp. NKZ332]|nr:hypothetical protein FO519_003517 [Halicephalobus sp. NKZ332]
MSGTSILNGEISIKQQIISASTGALATSLMVTPMDVVKIRLQSQVHPIAKGECFYYSNGLMDHLCVNCAVPKKEVPCEWFNRPGHFNGTIDAFIKITRNEGIRSLWSGLSPTIVSAIPATVLYYTLYDNLLVNSVNRFGEKFYIPLLVGVFSRTAAVTIVSPLEMIRTKMQSEQISYYQIGKALKSMIKSDGYSSLFRGLAPTIMRDIPFSAIYWTSFEALKKRFLEHFGQKKTTFGISFTCGAISGTIAAVVTQPFDLVKTQRQITLGEVGNGIQTFRVNETSTMNVIRKLVETRGYRAIFAGLTPRVVKVAPACATMIATYDYLKNFFHKRNLKKEVL